MTNRDRCFLSYLAGLIDGEGTVTITRESRYKTSNKEEHRDYWYYRPVISIGMTDALNLAIIKNYFKNRIKIKTSFWFVKKWTSQRRDYYRWEITTQTEAYEFLKLIQPFLINKYEQAKILTSFLVFMRKWKARNKIMMDIGFQRQAKYFHQKIISKHKEQLKGVNSVELLNRLDLRQYLSKREDVEIIRKNVKNLFERVETKLSGSTHNKIISAPVKDIVHN